jgi:hypothetical protein
MGRHLCYIIEKQSKGKKALIQHYEDGFVGNKKEGYKEVKNGDYDIAPIRLLRYKKYMEED